MRNGLFSSGTELNRLKNLSLTIPYSNTLKRLRVVSVPFLNRMHLFKKNRRIGISPAVFKYIQRNILLEQQHRFRIEKLSRLQPVKVNAAGHRQAILVQAVPRDCVRTCFLFHIDQGPDVLS